MDLTKEELSEKLGLSDNDIPPWATSLFEKMKAEICAEVHAKVAYSMRIMLDQFQEDLKLSLQSFQLPIKEDVWFCKEVGSCKEKYTGLCASHHLMTKEEKKRMKRAKKEEKKFNKQQKNVSESDTDSEKNAEANFTTVNLPVPAQKYDPTKAPPVPPRKTSPKKTSVTSLVSSPSDSLSQLNDVACNKELLAHITEGLNMDRQELLNGSVGMLNIEERTFQLQVPTEGQNEFTTPQGEMKESSNEEKLNNLANPVTEAVETVFSPSDSEFEVISMPHNIRSCSEYTSLPGNTSALMSDYDDSSSDGFNSETEYEFKDCKQPSPDVSNSLQPGGSLYPEIELKKMSLSLMSSTTSTLVDGYVSSCSTDGAVAVKSTTIEIERERSSYSVPSEDVEKINSEEIVHNQPLPSEFLRDRKPYSHVPLEEPKQPPPQSLNSQRPQQQTQLPKVSRPSSQIQRDSTYRVDNLPESLWDEALTVAAQTYNAAKSAVGTLADTFVPGAAAQAVASNPQPRNSPVRVQPAYRVEMAEKEQKLFEMGFLDHGLNATLLVRHNGDMDRVIAELIEP